jgi:hypothetical protein
MNKEILNNNPHSQDIMIAHQYCTNNKEDLRNDLVCGCFYCLEIFNPTEINEWIPDTKGTAVCPYCNVIRLLVKARDFL